MPMPRPALCVQPSVDEVKDAILPKYIQSRILANACSPQRHPRLQADRTPCIRLQTTPSLIDDLTRKLSTLRDRLRLPELTEIIGSADALNKKE